MGFFKKKVDPISERARTLNQQIAALEEEIKRLSSHESQENHSPAKGQTATPAASRSPDARQPATQPRLRSTALPHGHSGSTAHMQAQPQPQPAAPPDEPAFEEVNPFQPERHHELGVRKEEGPSVWQRIKKNFGGPGTTNPKLVNYLAAGSIQGLRPLRYEKRVARNRFLLLVIVLAVVLWGVVAALLKR